MSNFKYILFDLDGTLTDSKAGITNSYLFAVKKLALKEENPERIIQYIGQPLHKYFADIHSVRETDLEKAVELYREYYSAKGIYENTLYDGVLELLQQLKKGNKSIFLVTGKPLVFVKVILPFFKIDSYFVNVFGSGAGIINSSKEVLISQMLRENNPDLESTIMVGDTMYDIIGAKENGIKSIAVTYGYGSIDELKGCNPDFLVRSVEELSNILLI